jgi:hypothetical protein
LISTLQYVICLPHMSTALKSYLFNGLDDKS